MARTSKVLERLWTLLVAPLRLFHVELEAGILCLGFGVEPVGAALTASTDPSPLAHQTPVAEETGHNLHAVKPVAIRLGLCPGQVHAPTPTSWSRCPALPCPRHRHRSPWCSVGHVPATSAACAAGCR